MSGERVLIFWALQTMVKICEKEEEHFENSNLAKTGTKQVNSTNNS